MRVEAPQISRTNEALARRIEPLHFRRLLRVVVIPRHHCCRMAYYFSNFAGRYFSQVITNQADVMARNRSPHRAELVRMPVCLEYADPASFSHPVELDKSPWPARKNVRLQIGREWRGGGQLHFEARQSGSPECTPCHDALVLN